MLFKLAKRLITIGNNDVELLSLNGWTNADDYKPKNKVKKIEPYNEILLQIKLIFNYFCIEITYKSGLM
jgi:hypothetical protein